MQPGRIFPCGRFCRALLAPFDTRRASGLVCRVELVAERANAQTQELGGTGTITVGHLHRTRNQLGLGMIQVERAEDHLMQVSIGVPIPFSEVGGSNTRLTPRTRSLHETEALSLEVNGQQHWAA